MSASTSPSRTNLWRHRDFVKLWSATSVSQLGSMFGALSLTALLTLDASAGQMSVLAACSTVPVVLFSLVTGVSIDRLPRRPLMVAADLGRFVLLATIPVAALLDAMTIGHLYAVAFGVSLGDVVFNLAYRSAVPGLVPRDELVEANARLQMSESVAESGSPALGGAIVQVASGPFAVAIDALTFLVSALIVFTIRRTPVERPVEPRRSLRVEALEGIGTVARQPLLRAFAATAATVYGFGGFFYALYPVWVVQELGFSPVVLGVLIGAGGVGSIAGATFIGPLSRRFGVGPAMVGARFIAGVLALLTPLAGGPRELAFALLLVHQFVGDSMWTVYEVNALSLRQSVTPDRELGRVNATFLMLGEGLLPVGAIAAGLLATLFDVRTALAIGSVGMALGFVWLWASPARSMRTAPALKE